MALAPISRSSSCPNAVMISPLGRPRSTSPPGFVWRQATKYQGARFCHREQGGPEAAAVASAIGRRDHWADRYRAGRILPATIRPCRKIEGRHRDSPQDCRAVLQCDTSRYGLRRSGGVILRDPLPGASCQKSSSARQSLRVHSASRRDTSCRAGCFLGKLRRFWGSRPSTTRAPDG